MAKPIQVLIADDHTIFRSGLKLLLSAEPDIEVVGEATDADSAVAMAADLQPNVVLMSVGMPALNGFEATREIRQCAPEAGVLALSIHRSDENFFPMLEAGASGYLLKSAETNELFAAIRAVAQGDMYLHPSMARRLAQRYLAQTGAGGGNQPCLTPREREVLRMICEGYANKDIAERLFISPSTVHSHRTKIMQKLNLNSRHELVRYARQNELV